MNKPSVLLVASNWWPLSARLGLVFLRHGCRVSAVCPPGHPLLHVPGVERFHTYRGLDSLASLRRALTASDADVVVPCDDGVVAQLHALHRQEPSLRGLIERSLGPSASYPVVRSRHALLALAASLGVQAPETRRVQSADDVVAWHREVAPSGVLKVDGGCAGLGVRICHSLEASLAAWHELGRRGSAATAWKRLVIDRDPLALWTHRHLTERDVTIQAFVPGPPANTMLACWRGQLLGSVSVAVLATRGATGAATIVRPIRNEAMAQAAERLAAALQLTGFFGLDFVLDATTGTPHLIELNPRCTQLGHLELLGRCSLASAFAAALRGEAAPRAERPIRAQKIAIFPQALAGHAGQIGKGECHHDVPWEAPRLVRELLAEPWPERRWPARAYHALWPLDRSEPVAYEDLAPAGAEEATASAGVPFLAQSAGA